jgi:hypothetical protein
MPPELTEGAVVKLACGCIGQRATAQPHFVVRASCSAHAPYTIIEVEPDATVMEISRSETGERRFCAVTSHCRGPLYDKNGKGHEGQECCARSAVV